MNTDDLETAFDDKPPATKIELPQTIESEPAAIDPVAAETTSQETVSEEIVAAAVKPVFPEAEADSTLTDTVPAKAPEPEDQPDTIIGRVDDFSGESEVQLTTVSTLCLLYTSPSPRD